ncbi:MAG: hypothetical protein ACFE7R_10820, partial [Candidatus Hodarchaeota archaeon]
MSPDKKKPNDDKKPGVVDDLLEELGVDDELKQQLVESGRMQTDVLMVESADQVRRRMEIEKSGERMRDSIILLERNIMTVDSTVDRVERDLVPVVLSFLVGLKGNLVNLRTTIVGTSKRRAKTNLQHTFIETEVEGIVEEEFEKVEETLTSGMSAPIMEKVKDITDGLKAALKTTQEELTTLKGGVDDFTQRSSTEVEFLSKELLMKPRVQVPTEVAEKTKALERRVEELTRDLQVSEEKLKNREDEIESFRQNVIELKTKNEYLEETITQLKASPSVDPNVLSELRQNVKSLETSRDLLTEKLKTTEASLDEAEKVKANQKEFIALKEIEVADLAAQVKNLETEAVKIREE